MNDSIKDILKLIKNIKYLTGIRKSSLASIESIENPYEDFYEVRLKPSPDLTWSPGEHGMFKLPGKKVEGVDYRLFSVASTPEEGYMLLGMRTGKEISSFKKVLLGMKKGEQVSIKGPFGWFKIRDNTSPLVLFANGVGITPIRALVKELENDYNRPIEIVYASYKYYLFEEELTAIANKNPQMTLHKTVTPEETQMKLSQLADKYGNEAYYFISGSPAVLESVTALLKGKGIASKKIIDDTLKGY